MALESTRTIAELKEECENRNLTVIPTGKNGKYLKEDFIKALRADYLVERFGEFEDVPFPLRFMLTMDCPMLCKRYAAIKKQDVQISLWKNDGKYAAEEKIDGCMTYDTPVLLADGTTKPIGEIVENKLAVEVMSFDETTQTLVPRKVTNWFNHGMKKPEQWVRKILVHDSAYHAQARSCYFTGNHVFFKTHDEYSENFSGTWETLDPSLSKNEIQANNSCLVRVYRQNELADKQNKGYCVKDAGNGYFLVKVSCAGIHAFNETNVNETVTKDGAIAYDIEVEGCHNFIADGFIVHNSRSILIYDAERHEFDFYSRHNSVTDFLPISYKDTILVHGNYRGDTSFVLDCEVISTNANVTTKKTCTSQLNSTSAILALDPVQSREIQKNNPLLFVVFDCLYNGVDIRSLPWKDRHVHAEKLAKALKDAGFMCKINPYVLENKKEFYESIIKQGGEGCFSGETRILMADMTMKQIKNVCIGDEVMSYDGQNICKSTVERVFDNGIADADFFWRVYPATVSTVQGGGHFNERFEGNVFHAFNATKNHKFYTKCNFEPLDKCDKITKIGYRLDPYRYEALCGWLLSDGHIDKRNVVNVTQRDGEYMTFSEEMFARFKTKTRSFTSGKNSQMKVFYILKDFTKDFVRTGTMDEFKRELAKTMTPIRFAYMLMGDGCGDEKGIRISTEGMSEETLNVLMDTMKSLGFPVGSIHKDKRVHNGAGYALRFHKEVAKRLVEWCGAYVHPSMRYKIEKIAEIPEFIAPPDVVPVLYEQDFTKVSKELTHHKYRSRRYDLEVASTHCYFAEGVLVHNCVFKRTDAPYSSTTSRTDDMVKLKRTVACDLASDIDAWVSGFTEATKGKANENYIGGLIFSCKVLLKTGETVIREIGRVAGLPQDLRVEMTDYDAQGNPKLKQSYYGRVATISGQDISGVNKRLTHCVLKAWRYDKDPSGCEVLSEEELDKLIM